MMELFEEIYKRRKKVFACIQGKLFRNNICFLPQINPFSEAVVHSCSSVSQIFQEIACAGVSF